MAPILSISNLSKVYASGFTALQNVNLEIERGEIFGLLGPNGAGKTTLISIVCGLVVPSAGTITVDGHDTVSASRSARQKIGLVPQELATDAFETVWATVRLSRGMFGLPLDRPLLEGLLRDLTLWDKRDQMIMALSGGMKRRVMIAKALAHEPQLLFLDEPTAGVDVELRRDMWALVRKLRDRGVTVILTTHYIQEAEEMADRIGVLHRGELKLVKETHELMKSLGYKRLTFHLERPLAEVPAELSPWDLELRENGRELSFTFSAEHTASAVGPLLQRLDALGISFQDLRTHQSTLEEIFVGLVSEQPRQDTP